MLRKTPMRRGTWKRGKKPNRKSLRWEEKLLAHRKWRKEVLARDKNRCVFCGNRENLQGHHVCGRAPSVRSVIENGLTLCGACHEQVHRAIRLHRNWWKRTFPQRWEVVREALAKRGRAA